MSSLDNSSVTGATNQRNKRSFTSKLSSILSNKSTHINGFSIELDEPLRQYGPGDTVRGTIVLNVGKPLGVTHVVACLSGYVQVFKNHSKGITTPKITSGRVVTGQGKRWVSEYYGDGYASMFEEEIVLCGEGRLDPKLYHFRFEIDFPRDLALPSSIDFERGTITYTVSATITRPSSIAVQTSCDTKVLFRENIDIGALSEPTPYEVTLRPLDQSHKPRSSMKRLTSYDKKRTSRVSTPSNRNFSPRTLECREETASSRQPSLSIPSSRSSSSSRIRVASLTSEFKSSRQSLSPHANSESPNKSISVVVELSRSGCLAGEILPVFISIAHTKVIHSLHGVIVTLYRQARVDMHPNLPVVSGNKAQDGRPEDYYPRSKTGLGGLSLTAAGSSQTWRKDLSQTFAPLYIDPRTKTTEIKVAVRVPDEVFPSIRNVPGEMISFKYYVEVIIDIHGKLASGPSFSALNTAMQQGSPATPKGQNVEAAEYLAAAWETNFVDTTIMRRERSAVVVQCDLVIGTRDSEKTRRKQKEKETYYATERSAGDVDQIAPDTTVRDEFQSEDGNAYAYNPDEQVQYEETGDEYAHGEYYEDGYGYEWGNGYYDPSISTYPYDPRQSDGDHADMVHYGTQSHFQIPPPELVDESNMSEKERLRRAEARLLPSQPPLEEGFSSPNLQDVPTAPILPPDASYTTMPYLPRQEHATVGGGVDTRQVLPSPVHNDGPAPRTTLIMGVEPCRTPDSSTPQTDASASSGDREEDKQELERRRLQARASAPLDYHIVPGRTSTPSAVLADDSPSAPVLTDEEAGILGRERGNEAIDIAREFLPRYER